MPWDCDIISFNHVWVIFCSVIMTPTSGQVRVNVPRIVQRASELAAQLLPLYLYKAPDEIIIEE